MYFQLAMNLFWFFLGLAFLFFFGGLYLVAPLFVFGVGVMVWAWLRPVALSPTEEERLKAIAKRMLDQSGATKRHFP